MPACSRSWRGAQAAGVTLLLAIAAPLAARAQSVRQVREELLADYERRVASGASREEAWAKSRERAIELERGSPRRAFVDDVMRGIDQDVRDGAIAARDGEKPVLRTGAEPTQSRGQFSDEDFECRDPRCVQRFRDEARRRKLPVKHDRLSMQIDEHDILVWKPQAKPPPAQQLGAAWDHALAGATNREFAPSAKPGAHARPMEAVLDNLNKGLDGLGKPPSQWGSSYEALERHTVTTKDVLRSFEQTGLCDARPADCVWLRERRAMTTPPPASDAERRVLFAKEQDRLRSFMRDAFDSAERSLRDEARALERALAKPGLDPARRLELRGDAANLRDKMRGMYSRFDALHEQSPELLKFVSGSRERSRFLAGLQDQMRQLDKNAGIGKPASAAAADAERSHEAARRMKAYTVVLSAAQLTQCMTEGRAARQCAVEALEAAAEGIAESGAVMLLSLVTPTGALIASTTLAIRGGVYTVVASTLAVRDATLESFRLASALAEERRAEQTLSAAQQANASRYGEQYARELAVFRQTAERIAAARQAQLARLDVLEEAYTGLRRDLGSLRESLAAHEPRLVAVRVAYATLAERCHLLGHLEIRAADAAEQALGAENEREGRLAQAREALVACASGDAPVEAERILGDGGRARAELATRIGELRDLRGQIGASLPQLAAGVGQAAGGRAGSEDLASRVGVALEQLLAEAQALESGRSYLEADFPAEVAALNSWIEAERGKLEGGLDGFEAAFPPELRSQEPGFAILRMHVNAIEPLASSDWEPRWKAIRAGFPAGYPADATTGVAKVKALAAKFPIATVEPCRSPLAEKVDQIDADLASAAMRLSASGERESREAALLHLPRERCIAKLGTADSNGSGAGDADQARRRRLKLIREAQSSPGEISDYHSAEARRERELAEERRLEKERRDRERAAERERAWQAGMESFERGLQESLSPPVPASPSRSAPEITESPAGSAGSECRPTTEFERCALQGESACENLGRTYDCERYCRCHVLEPR